MALQPGLTSTSLGELATYLQAELRGDAKVQVCGLATLATATAEQLAFLANPKYASQLETTAAAAVILAPDVAADFSGNCLVLDNPYLGFARASRLFDRRPRPEPGIHPTAVVDPSASVDATASIGPNVVIAADVRIGAGTEVGAGSTIGARSVLGADCLIHPRVSIAYDVHLGDRVRVHSGAVIGSDGFGFARDGAQWIKIAQLGGVRIGDDADVGACTTIDRGALDDTIIEEGVILDNQIQIAHNVRVGAYTAIAACTGIAGSTRIGRNCTIAGGVGISGHLEICDGVHLGGMCMVTRSIKEPGAYGSALSAMPMDQYLKSAVRIRQLDGLAKQVRKLERKLEKDT